MNSRALNSELQQILIDNGKGLDFNLSLSMPQRRNLESKAEQLKVDLRKILGV